VKKGMGVVVATVFLMAAVCVAQEQNRDADHVALRGLMAKVVKAIDERDMKTLMSCFAKEFVFTSIDQTSMTNEAQVFAFNDRLFVSKDAPMAKVSVLPEADTLTRFIGDNAGYCFGTSLETYTLKDGRIFKMTNRWTAMVVKENAEWKIAAVHAGVNVMDNPILQAKSMGFWRKLGVTLHLCKPPWQKAK
jgi:ketosteroid isomerase-like protein